MKWEYGLRLLLRLNDKTRMKFFERRKLNLVPTACKATSQVAALSVFAREIIISLSNFLALRNASKLNSCTTSGGHARLVLKIKSGN